MDTKIDRRLSWFFLLAGVCLLGAAAYFYHTPLPSDPSDPALDVQTDIVVADGVVGKNQEVVIRLDNRTRNPVRIYGLVEC